MSLTSEVILVCDECEDEIVRWKGVGVPSADYLTSKQAEHICLAHITSKDAREMVRLLQLITTFFAHRGLQRVRFDTLHGDADREVLRDLLTASRDRIELIMQEAARQNAKSEI